MTWILREGLGVNCSLMVNTLYLLVSITMVIMHKFCALQINLKINCSYNVSSEVRFSFKNNYIPIDNISQDHGHW